MGLDLEDLEIEGDSNISMDVLEVEPLDNLKEDDEETATESETECEDNEGFISCSM